MSHALALSLFPRPITPQGLTLANALYFNKTLRRLNITCNQIPPRAAYAIAMAMRTQQTLEFLSVEDNPVGYAGGRALMGVVLDFGHTVQVKMG
jgi:Ran GTPase-activating protein (RanGAP) involved in mRNA processing and transport